MLERDSWRILEIIIRRYPDKKKEYEEYLAEVMGSSPGEGVPCCYREDYTKPQSVTEAKALKLNSAYAQRLKNQIEAVEFVYNSLNDAEQKLMRERFWRDRKRNIPYLKIRDVSYSERQMRRIVYGIIVRVGKYLGEIR